MNKAFTLIELLIVVAIIAILAAIAVPNFLEAQVRAKASRMKSDLRTAATGLETYAVDYNQYPLANNFSLSGARKSPDEQSDPVLNAQRRVLERLSTPVAYLTNGFITDIFQPNGRRSSISLASPQGNFTSADGDANYDLVTKYVKYVALNPSSGTAGTADVEALDGPAKAYVVSAAGPARAYPNLGTVFSAPTADAEPLAIQQMYDPTNGTVSYGYIFRVGGTTIDQYGGVFVQVAARNAK